MSYVKTPKILLPNAGIDDTLWAVIACDQFTSEPEYWLKLKRLVDGVPSTYHLILPEVFLDQNPELQINQVNRNMSLYLRSQMFTEQECMILVERKTPYTDKRLGLVLMIDLEEYEYQEGVKAKIVASEKTVPERIPPRVRIRENAPIELPHVLVLIDDHDTKIIDHLYQQKDNYPVAYDFPLNMDGGHLKGYVIENTKPILQQLESIKEEIKMVVGDGNHSLASAKSFWQTLKPTLSKEDQLNHPARYALVEVISLYDPGLTFEPIHRVLFHVENDFIDLMKQTLSGDATLEIITSTGNHKISVPENPFTAIKFIQEFLDDYLAKHKNTDIDFVHGLDSLESIIHTYSRSVGITMPPLKRDELFPYVKEYGVLPRKSFSLGEAKEKRYYMECRRIQKEKK